MATSDQIISIDRLFIDIAYERDGHWTVMYSCIGSEVEAEGVSLCKSSTTHRWADMEGFQQEMMRHPPGMDNCVRRVWVGNLDESEWCQLIFS